MLLAYFVEVLLNVATCSGVSTVVCRLTRDWARAVGRRTVHAAAHSKQNAHVYLAAMFRRAIYKNAWRVLSYYVIYSLLTFAIIPEPEVTFVSDEFRIGGKYVLMFLVAPPRPVFSDSDGTDVFATRRCGGCFITNNKGFLPISEYDAVLVFGKRNLLSEAEAAMEPGKRYLIETESKCIKDKFKGCRKEPSITSFGTQESYTLCSLCKHLIQEKYKVKQA